MKKIEILNPYETRPIGSMDDEKELNALELARVRPLQTRHASLSKPLKINPVKSFFRGNSVMNNIRAPATLVAPERSLRILAAKQRMENMESKTGPPSCIDEYSSQ